MKPAYNVKATRNYSYSAEQPLVPETHTSPTHRFNFKLGRRSRSFSNKESSSYFQNSAASSGLVMAEMSSDIDHCSPERPHSRTRGRSPLRRLLDPLLKYTAAIHETSTSSNHSVHSSEPESIIVKEKKGSSSIFQAVIHLVMKNGHPSFKLVVNNNSNNNSIMIASVKKVLSPRKSGASTIVGFYSSLDGSERGLHKNMNREAKSNVVGQMKISSIYARTNGEDYGGCVERECVLYRVDQDKAEAKGCKLPCMHEIAAVIVKNSSLDDEEVRNTTFVILPDGVHTIPIKGEPSSLASRWRSGSCDCGGWDVGCKIQVLTSHSQYSNALGQMLNSASDRISLFIEKKNHKTKLVFRLEPVSRGLYSIIFDASVSQLEAFAIAVAFITCQHFSKILDANEMAEVEHLAQVNAAAYKTDIDDISRSAQCKVVHIPGKVGRWI